jgi:hypothetical protein
MTLVKCANLTQGRKIMNALREKEKKKGRPCVVCSRSTRQETTDWAGNFFKKGHCRIKKTKKELDLKFDLTQSTAACIQRMHLSKRKKHLTHSLFHS